MWGNAAFLFLFPCVYCWHSHLSRWAIFLFLFPGDPKINETDKFHKMHVPNIQGHVFPGNQRLRQAHRPRGRWSAHVIATSYRYTDTLQVCSAQNTSPYKSRHPNTINVIRVRGCPPNVIFGLCVCVCLLPGFDILAKGLSSQN